MAKIIIAGDALVVQSTATLEDIKTLEKYKPEALSLYGEDENGKRVAIFKVGTTEGKGNINQYGASFGSASHDEEKKATITLCIPEGTEDVVSYAADLVGYATAKLNQLEEKFALALAEVKAQREEIVSNITVA